MSEFVEEATAIAVDRLRAHGAPKVEIRKQPDGSVEVIGTVDGLERTIVIHPWQSQAEE
jgi:hypothetical protein